MNEPTGHVLPGALDVQFGDIEAARIRLGGADPLHASQALIATVVVVAPRERLGEAAQALEELGDPSGVRSILIAHDAGHGQHGSTPQPGGSTPPQVRVAAHAVLLEGLKAEHLNNAVAALRLSSLPTLVWWRDGSPDVLDSLAMLADRLVLDAPDPTAVWSRVGALAEHTAVTDLRWTLLTRWRALTAHFFDIPGVCDAASSFRSLEICAGDRHAARLFAAWLKSSLTWPQGLAVQIQHVPGGAPIESIHLGDGKRGLNLSLASGRSCVTASVDLADNASASSVVAIGDQRLSALIAEELRVRSHDAAFERSIRAIGALA